MYICKRCGNKVEFEEVNVVKTYINQENETPNSKDEFFYREDVVCLVCGCNMDNKDVIDIGDSGYCLKDNNVLLEISNYCANECGNKESCAEEDCVLYRVEKIVSDNK